MTNEKGKTDWEYSYYLYSKPIQEIAHTEPEILVTIFRQRTGLIYNTFRYCDPDIGRFTQPDPIGLAGGYNLYQYAPNALMWIDA
ncbi:hypothetical protein SASC598O02_000710 [Snodgrassella alvi SCGC AB-598-O02]|nr:hypothetical protein SASC598O02_000710 [Snodgrassella alvi SCGC AB-598-O02]